LVNSEPVVIRFVGIKGKIVSYIKNAWLFLSCILVWHPFLIVYVCDSLGAFT
jgi:hypothetical protein